MSRSSAVSARFTANWLGTPDWWLSPPSIPPQRLADGGHCMDAAGAGPCCMRLCQIASQWLKRLPSRPDPNCSCLELQLFGPHMRQNWLALLLFIPAETATTAPLARAPRCRVAIKGAPPSASQSAGAEAQRRTGTEARPTKTLFQKLRPFALPTNQLATNQRNHVHGRRSRGTRADGSSHWRGGGCPTRAHCFLLLLQEQHMHRTLSSAPKRCLLSLDGREPRMLGFHLLLH